MLNGTTHACIGQEADAVAVIEHLARRRPRLLQPPLPRPLPGPHRRRARPDGRDHGQAGGRVRRHRRQPAPVRARLQVQRHPGRHRARRGRHRAGQAARRRRRRQRRVHRRRHPRRGRRLRDAEHRLAVEAAALVVLEDNGWAQSTPSQRQPRRQHARPLRGLRAAGLRDRLAPTSSELDARRRATRIARGRGPAAARGAASSTPTGCATTPRTTTTARAEEVAARWALDPLVDPRPPAGPGRPRARSTPRSRRRWPRSSRPGAGRCDLRHARWATRCARPSTTTTAWSCSARTSPTPTAARSR